MLKFMTQNAQNYREKQALSFWKSGKTMNVSEKPFAVEFERKYLEIQYHIAEVEQRMNIFTLEFVVRSSEFATVDFWKRAKF